VTKMVNWFLVMNETRARLVPGLPAIGAAAAPELVIRSDNHTVRKILADKTARRFASGDGHSMDLEDGSDPLMHDKIVFLREAFSLVEAHRRAGSFDRLVIVAGPTMLGLLRDEMPKLLRKVVSREIPRNLAGLTEAALLEALREYEKD